MTRLHRSRAPSLNRRPTARRRRSAALQPLTHPPLLPWPGTAAVVSAQPAGLAGKLVIQTQWGGTFYLYDLASGALAPVSSGLDPALSPDSTQIAFTRIGGSAGGVYLINSDGSNERQIFKASEQLMAPKWSPDGKWIVFSRSNGSYTCNDIAFVGCLSDSQLFPVPPGGLPPALEEARKDVLDGFERVSCPNWQLSRVAISMARSTAIPAALNSARSSGSDRMPASSTNPAVASKLPRISPMARRARSIMMVGIGP